VDDFKLAHFRKSHPGATPPEVNALSDSEALAVRRLLASRLGIAPEISREGLVAYLDARETTIIGVDATRNDFALTSVMRSEKIVPSEEVMLNWYRFDAIDRVRWADLSTFFDDIWYPSSDDIDVFDSSYDWVVSVCHSGSVKVLHLA
jgi:hypothetical protein